MLEDFLAVLMPLAGKCFVATLSPGIEDTHCFKTLYENAHIEDRHVVKKDGQAIYEGLSIYSATPEGLFVTYVNSDGGSGSGTAKVSGTSFDYQMTMRATSEAQGGPYSGRWTVKADGYDVTVPGEDVHHYALVR
jgi:hypothetical protein